MSNSQTQKIESQIHSFESLLNSSSSIQEVFSTGMQSLISIIKSQQSSIKSLEQQLSQKASKTELSSGLNIKANIADIMRTFSEVAANIDNRPTTEEVQMLIDDKVSHNELNDILSSKPSMEDIRQYLSSSDVKVSLKYHIDDISKNFVSIKDFTEAMNAKANKDNIISALHKKANKSDIESYINNKFDIEEIKNIYDALNRKVGFEDMEKIQSDTKAKCSKDIEVALNRIDDIDQDLDRLVEKVKMQFQSVNNALNTLTSSKADYKEMEGLVGNIKKQDSNILDMNNMLLKYKDQFNEISNSIKENNEQMLIEAERKLKDNIEQYKTGLTSEIRYVNNDMNKMNKALEQFVNRKEFELLSSKLINDTNALISSTKNRVEFHDLDALYKSIQKEIGEKMEQHYLSIQECIKSFDNDIQGQLDKKANVSEMNALLNSKADLNSISVALDQKASNKALEQFKMTFEQVVNESLNKVDYSKFDSFINDTQLNFEEIRNELMVKANIKEMIAYLKNKADIDEVNKALIQIHDELDSKPTLNDFNQAMDNQNAINDALCHENSLGKWTWESGKVKNGFAVPWENQLINTSPDNLIWEKDKTNIMIMIKGIYQFTFAFFTNSKPTVQVLVNGDVVLSCVNSNSFVIQQTTKDKITGMTMSDYFNLPDKARITISFAGESDSCGFLIIKKIA